MLSVSALIHGTVTVRDVRRHGRGTRGVPAPLLHFTAAHPPVVVWNVTRRCNLHCVHCYASAQDRPYPGELTTAEGLALLADLAGFGVPVVLFSGGEPLTRPDLFVLMRRARELGMRTVLSTNGTLIGAAEAEALRAVGVSYVGVSLDGLERTHDRVRGARGAFQAALAGIKACQAAGLRVGLRVTVHRGNVAEVPELLRLMEEERIGRLCLYHLAYAGRGARIAPQDLSPGETRALLEALFGWVASWPKDDPREVLTVEPSPPAPLPQAGEGCPKGGVRARPQRAAEVAELLGRNGGNQSGVRIACVSPRGDVHPDQFSWHQVFGNVRERPFSVIWSDETHPLMAFYRHRRGRIGGRCRSCRFFDWCNGNLRVRAEVAGGDLTGEDPACYLTPEEIAAGPDESGASTA